METSDKNILDLDDISPARVKEVYLPWWVRILGAPNNDAFYIKIIN
jgi:hypothetical protein